MRTELDNAEERIEGRNIGTYSYIASIINNIINYINKLKMLI